MSITLHPYSVIQRRQQNLLVALQVLQNDTSREAINDFMLASAEAFKAGNGLGMEQITEIFDEVYGPMHKTDNHD